MLLGCSVLALAAGVFWLPSVRASRLLAQAEQALAARRTEEAVSLLDQVSELVPESSDAEFLLARVARREGRFSDVQRHLARAAELGFDPQRIQREGWLAMAQAGQMREATPHLETLLRDPRGDGQNICEAYVEGYFATYRFDLAVPLIDAWSADFPEDPQPHFYRGAYYDHFDNWSKAADSYRVAHTLDPERVDISLRLADLLVRLHEYDEAGNHFQRCLEKRPTDPLIRCGWARCLLAKGELADAEREILDVVQAHPEYDDAELVLGQIQHANGRDDASQRTLETYCERHPTDSEARYLYAQVLQALGRQKEAAAHFEFVVEAREKVAEIEPLMARLKQDPANADIRYEIGIRVLHYDIPEHGAEWLRSAVDADPNHAAAHRELAGYYATAGQTELADYHRRRAEEAEGTAGDSVTDKS